MGGAFNSVEVIKQHLLYTWGERDNLVVKINLDNGDDAADAIAKWAVVIEIKKEDCEYWNLYLNKS